MKFSPFLFVFFLCAFASNNKFPKSSADISHSTLSPEELEKFIIAQLNDLNTPYGSLNTKLQLYNAIMRRPAVFSATPNALRVNLVEFIEYSTFYPQMAKNIELCVQKHWQEQDPVFFQTGLLQLDMILVDAIVLLNQETDEASKEIVLTGIEAVLQARHNLLESFKDNSMLMREQFQHFPHDSIYELARSNPAFTKYVPSESIPIEEYLSAFPHIKSQHHQFAIRDRFLIYLTSRSVLPQGPPGTFLRWFRMFAMHFEGLNPFERFYITGIAIRMIIGDEKKFPLIEPLLETQHIIKCFRDLIPPNDINQIPRAESLHKTITNPRAANLFILSRFDVSLYSGDLAIFSLPGVLIPCFSGDNEAVKRFLSVILTDEARNKAFLSINQKLATIKNDPVVQAYITNRYFCEASRLLQLNPVLRHKAQLGNALNADAISYSYNIFSGADNKRAYPTAADLQSGTIDKDFLVSYVAALYEEEGIFSQFVNREVTELTSMDDHPFILKSLPLAGKGSFKVPEVTLPYPTQLDVTVAFPFHLSDFVEDRLHVLLFAAYHLNKQPASKKFALPELNQSSPLAFFHDLISREDELKESLKSQKLVDLVLRGLSFDKVECALLRDALCLYAITHYINPFVLLRKTCKTLPTFLYVPFFDNLTQVKEDSVKIKNLSFDGAILYAYVKIGSALNKQPNVDLSKLGESLNKVKTNPKYPETPEMIRKLLGSCVGILASHELEFRIMMEAVPTQSESVEVDRTEKIEVVNNQIAKTSEAEIKKASKNSALNAKRREKHRKLQMERAKSKKATLVADDIPKQPNIEDWFKSQVTIEEEPVPLIADTQRRATFASKDDEIIPRKEKKIIEEAEESLAGDYSRFDYLLRLIDDEEEPIKDFNVKSFEASSRKLLQKPKPRGNPSVDLIKSLHKKVDKSNIVLFYPQMIHDIQRSDIISLDMETTGIVLEPKHVQECNREIFGRHFSDAKKAVYRRVGYKWVACGVLFHQVLQYGFTCIRRNSRGVLEPFAIYSVNALYEPLTESDFNSVSLDFLRNRQQFDIAEWNEKAAVGSVFNSLAQAILERNVPIMFFHGYADMMHLYKHAGRTSFHNREFFQYNHRLIDVKTLRYGALFCQGESLEERFQIEDLVELYLPEFASVKLHDAGVDSYVTWLLYRAISEESEGKGYPLSKYERILCRPANELFKIFLSK